MHFPDWEMEIEDLLSVCQPQNSQPPLTPTHWSHKYPLCLTTRADNFQGVFAHKDDYNLQSCIPQGFLLQGPRRWAGIRAYIFVGRINTWIKAAMGNFLSSGGLTRWTSTVAWHTRYTQREQRWKHVKTMELCTPLAGTTFRDSWEKGLIPLTLSFLLYGMPLGSSMPSSLLSFSQKATKGSLKSGLPELFVPQRNLPISVAELQW